MIFFPNILNSRDFFSCRRRHLSIAMNLHFQCYHTEIYLEKEFVVPIDVLDNGMSPVTSMQ